MIIDASAILAVIVKEPGYERIVHELAASSGTRIGAPTRLETGIVLTARFGPRGRTVLARFLQENYIQTVAFDDAHADAALDAYSRFGKGRHRAALNFGDCCTYAIASVADEPLLCVGDDFAQTDLLLVGLDTDKSSTDLEESSSPAHGGADRDKADRHGRVGRGHDRDRPGVRSLLEPGPGALPRQPKVSRQDDYNLIGRTVTLGSAK